MIKQLLLPEIALTMAKISESAYEDNNADLFKNLGFTRYKFLNIDGAHGHLAASSQEVIISCRGTQPKQLKDLLADLNTMPKRTGHGYVHAGFRREAKKLLWEVVEWVQSNKEKDIYITGHSLGAAMGTYLAEELEHIGHKNIKLFTFGSPRLGSAEFVNNMKVQHWRFVNCNDLVTHVPPIELGFKHHGKLCYINFHGNIKTLSTWQRRIDMIKGHIHALCKLTFFDGLRDHFIDGYVVKLKNICDTKQDINI